MHQARLTRIAAFYTCCPDNTQAGRSCRLWIESVIRIHFGSATINSIIAVMEPRSTLQSTAMFRIFVHQTSTALVQARLIHVLFRVRATRAHLPYHPTKAKRDRELPKLISPLNLSLDINPNAEQVALGTRGFKMASVLCRSSHFSQDGIDQY